MVTSKWIERIENLIEQEFLTVAEVAILFKTKKAFIYDLIALGELKAIRLSERRTRILTSSVQEFTNQKTQSQSIGLCNDRFNRISKRGRKPKYSKAG